MEKRNIEKMFSTTNNNDINLDSNESDENI